MLPCKSFFPGGRGASVLWKPGTVEKGMGDEQLLAKGKRQTEISDSVEQDWVEKAEIEAFLCLVLLRSGMDVHTLQSVCVEGSGMKQAGWAAVGCVPSLQSCGSAEATFPSSQASPVLARGLGISNPPAHHAAKPPQAWKKGAPSSRAVR